MAALLDIVLKGSTDRSVTIRIIDSVDGTPETGVVFNTAGIDLWYRRESGSVVSISEATQTVNGAHADGGFVHIANGEYRLDLPDAAFATAANYVDIGGTVTGMIVIGGRVRLVDVNLEDVVRAGLTALPNVAQGNAGALVTAGTGTAQLDVGSGRAQADVARWAGGTPNALATGRVDASVGAMATDVISSAALSAAAANEIRDAILAAVVETQGSITLAQALSIAVAALAGETAISGNTYQLETPNGAVVRVTATLDANKQRTAITLNL